MVGTSKFILGTLIKRFSSFSWVSYAYFLQFVDFETGFCGLYFSHLLPPGDPETAALYAEFQAAVHSANT